MVEASYNTSTLALRVGRGDSSRQETTVAVEDNDFVFKKLVEKET
jgi:hypothetical protein